METNIQSEIPADIQSPSLPATDTQSDRFHRGGRESNFLPVKEMSHRILILLTLASMGLSQRALAANLSLGSPTVDPGTTVAISVLWTGPALNYLTTEFIVTAVSGAPTGQVSFSSPVAVPPLSQLDYVFYNNSDSLITLPAANPASIYQTNWTNDTYNFADSTNDSNNATPSAGTNLWTILNLTFTGAATGQYQISLGSSEYTDSSTLGTGPSPTFSGGLITMNLAPAAATPEPAGFLLGGGPALIGVGALLRRRVRPGQAAPVDHG